MSRTCGNKEFHRQDGDGSIPAATWAVTWPFDEFDPTDACEGCLTEIVLPDVLEDRHAMTITPLAAPGAAAEGSGQ